MVTSAGPSPGSPAIGRRVCLVGQRGAGAVGHGFGTRRDRSNIAVARFLDMPRRIAQERVPTASNVGSRDVTSASQPTPLTPFRVFSRVSRAPFLRQSAKTNSEGQVKYCRQTFFGHATPDRAGARPLSNVGSRDVTSASQPTPLIPFRVF